MANIPEILFLSKVETPFSVFDFNLKFAQNGEMLYATKLFV